MIDASGHPDVSDHRHQWLDGQKREMLASLIEENRVLRRQGGRRLRLTDEDPRNLAARDRGQSRRTMSLGTRW